MENGTSPSRREGVDSDNDDRLATWSVSKNGEDASHTRTSTGSTLGSLSFLEPSRENRASNGQPQRKGEEEVITGERPKNDVFSVHTPQLSQGKGKKKALSLRKTAMLGTQENHRERSSGEAISMDNTTTESIGNLSKDSARRSVSHTRASLNSSSDSGWAPESTSHIATSAVSNPQPADSQRHSIPQLLESHLTSTSNTYTSTTDDDEGVPFFQPATSNSILSYNVTQLSSQGPAMSLHRRQPNRSGQQHSSLSTSHTPVGPTLEEEWDYSETEWWGWVVLIATWVVFVVGMGSCLGIWSWAWDVGETPYAPPELEDDPTLPIVGYYPALMVCTAVMAWVWVVVAWVGMKYFRHSKVVVEDG